MVALKGSLPPTFASLAPPEPEEGALPHLQGAAGFDQQYETVSLFMGELRQTLHD